MMVAVIRMLKIVTMRLIYRKDSIYWKRRLGRTSKLLPWSWTIFSNVLSRDTTRKWKTSMAPIGSKTKRSNFRGIYENFGSPNNVIKVLYSNRFRIRFPCPVEGCGFKTVDLKKHLLSTHKWSDQESKLLN